MTMPPVSLTKGAELSPVELRPLTLADILDGTFRLIKRNWRQLGLLSLMLAIPSALITALLQAANTDFGAEPSLFALLLNGDLAAVGEQDEPLSLASIIAIFGSLAVTLVLAVTIQPLIIGALVRVIAASYMGRSEAAWPALKATLRRWPALIAVSVVELIALGIGLLVCFIGVLVPLTLFAVVIAVVVIEDAGPIKAIERSFSLTVRRFWWYLLTLVIIIILANIISGVIGTPLIVVSTVASAFGIDAVEWIFAGLSTLASTVFTLPISVVAFVLIYFDARVRFEGLDLQVRAGRGPAAF